MTLWLRWARSTLPLVALVQGACAPPPGEVSTTTEAGSSGSTAGPAETAPGVTTDVVEPTSVATTGEGDTTTSVDGTTGSSESSSGPAPGCMAPEDCDSNQACETGECVDACGGAWGMGSYGYCFTEYGAVATDDLCGPDHTCVYWSDRHDQIEQTACALQGCMSACDCPPPAATGNATVSCGQITDPETMDDCFLSCKNGEDCPDDMFCTDTGVCATDAPEVPVYGDCGNLAPACAAPGFCVDVPSGESVCTMGCADVGECAAAFPTGGTSPVTCTDVVPATEGFECYLSCIGFTCPDEMTCVNGTLCMWPV
jgi:hypothetical protein